MKTLDSITRRQVKDEYNLTEAFMKRHAREMGGLGKPMVFDRDLVELFLRERMWKDRLAKEVADEQGRDIKAEIERIIRRASVTPIGAVREIRGRGGKGRAA